MDEKNKLYFGDNLKILREYVPDASVDLIYLDPPFNSSATYIGALCSAALQGGTGRAEARRYSQWRRVRGSTLLTAPSPSRGCADHGLRSRRAGWQWGLEPEAVYKEIVTSGPRKLADLMQALLGFMRKLLHTIFGMFKHHQPYAGTKLFARLSPRDVTCT